MGVPSRPRAPGGARAGADIGLNVDVYNISELLAGGVDGRGGGSVLEIEAFYGTAALQARCQPGFPYPASGDPQDHGGVLAALFDASGRLLASTGDAHWLAFDGSASGEALSVSPWPGAR